MYKEDLALNNLQGLICQKPNPRNRTKLSFNVFRLLSSSLLIYSHCFSQFHLLHMFHVELGSLHRISNRTLYLI